MNTTCEFEQTYPYYALKNAVQQPVVELQYLLNIEHVIIAFISIVKVC